MGDYSIDLGIHPDATGGCTGSDEKDPYPLQIALTKGTLVVENDRYTGFTPTGLASFNQIWSGDRIIFRVFDITPVAGAGDRSVQDVISFTITFNTLKGSKTTAPWEPKVGTISRSSDDQVSPAFTCGTKILKLPCYFQRDTLDGIVTYTVLPPNTKNPIPYLFSVQVETRLDATSTRYYHQDDPEMVVSPDGGPGGPPRVSL